MPGKNIIKTYIENGFYHIYNRGVEKRWIFLDDQDYRVFFSYLDLYLLPKEDSINKIKNKFNLTDDDKNNRIAHLLLLNNFYKKIEILSYILKPNHLHFGIKQIEKNSMEIFMQSLITKYVKYFNKKYQRVGPLFQGRYKAILIEKEEYLLHLSRYIHINAKEELLKNQNLLDYPWSSYPSYVKGMGPKWLNKEYILSYFKQTQGFSFDSYQGFVEGYKEKLEEESDLYKKLLLD